MKTDYYHGKAYPTFLYYNPYAVSKKVDLHVGVTQVDVYDAVTARFVQRNVKGRSSVTIPADTAVVLVLVPAGGRVEHQGRRTLVDGVVIDYGVGATPEVVR